MTQGPSIQPLLKHCKPHSKSQKIGAKNTN